MNSGCRLINQYMLILRYSFEKNKITYPQEYQVFPLSPLFRCCSRRSFPLFGLRVFLRSSISEGDAKWLTAEDPCCSGSRTHYSHLPSNELLIPFDEDELKLSVSLPGLLYSSSQTCLSEKDFKSFIQFIEGQRYDPSQVLSRYLEGTLVFTLNHLQ